jgi:flagellar assembly factor FliW
MIKFKTTRFGELEVDESMVINFPDGLIGLPDSRRYVLIDHKDSALKWLQSLDEPEIALIVVPPTLIAAEFEMRVDPPVKRLLELENEEDLAIFVTIRVSGDNVIANFQGPILINSLNRRGVQVIFEGARTLDADLSAIA